MSINQEIKRLYLMVDADGHYIHTIQAIADQVGLTFDATRMRINGQSWRVKDRRKQLCKTKPSDIPQPTHHRINADGSQLSQRVLALTDEQRSSPAALLKAHGMDPDCWELVSAVNNIWHMQSQGSPVPLYQSKITIKPYADGWSDILAAIANNTVPVTVQRANAIKTDSYLLIALNDIHMGSMVYEDYCDTQDRILDLIDEGHHKVIVWLAGDLFDTDNLRGTTAHGTHIADIDMPKAWADLSQLIVPIIKQAVSMCDTEVILTRGNHSESMEFAFSQYLKVLIPQAKHDDRLDYIKAVLLGKSFVGLSHGYGRTKSIAINLSKLYPQLWAAARHHEVLIGHEHKERKEDGILLRVMPTRAKPNDWSREQGFGIEHQSLQCLQYGPYGIEAVHYV